MSWANISCHPRVRDRIIRAIQRGYFGRTSLVFGLPGAGQPAVARAIAMTLVCRSREDGFCGVCSNCRRIQDGVYPDVIEMHPWENWADPDDKEKREKQEKANKKRKKNEYKVEHMRVMQEQAMHLPYEGDLKIYLIHDAHWMNMNSSNSLLKILEEPHSHVRFILTTDQPAGILPTIRSRCWSIRLIPLEIDVLAQSLQKELPPDQAATVARTAGGLPDQARILIEEGYLERRDWLFERLAKVKKRESGVIEAAEEIARSRDDLSQNLTILFRIVRDGLVAVSGGDARQFENQDRSGDLQRLWLGSNADRLIDSMKCVLNALEDSERFVNPTILLMDILLQTRRAMMG